MRKILTITVLVLFCWSSHLHSKEILIRNQTYEGFITIMGKKYFLPDGQWIYMDEWTWEVYGITGNGRTFIKIENEELKEIYDIGLTSIGGSALMEVVAPWIRSMFIENPYDGCYEKDTYHYLKVYTKGSTINCLKIRHYDVNQELTKRYSQEYPWTILQTGQFKKRAGNIFNVPKILISREHLYFSTLAGGLLNWTYHMVNPELYNVGQTISGNESTTEYHKYNLKKHPKKKKFMEDFIKESEQKHIEFEDFMRAKKHHRLELQREEIKQTNVDKDILKKLNDLNKLYKSGALTKEEFEKAKAKVLN